MAKVKLKYLIDENGAKTAVVLPLKEYKQLLRRLEDLEDALDLDEATKNATGFRDYSEIRKELQKQGKL